MRVAVPDCVITSNVRTGTDDVRTVCPDRGDAGSSVNEADAAEAEEVGDTIGEPGTPPIMVGFPIAEPVKLTLTPPALTIP